MSIIVDRLNNKNSKLLEDIEEAAAREQEQKRRIDDLEAEIQVWIYEQLKLSKC